MNAQQAWQSVLDQLQTEMPKASFDSWLRDTHAVSLDAKTIIVTVHNAYAREWIESRLQSTITRLLVGITNTHVDAQFVMEDSTIDPDQTDEESSGSDIETMDLTEYRNEVHPDRVAMCEGYELRLIEHGDISPKELSLWLGFRQAIYRKVKAGQGTIHNIPHYEITRFAMMSRAVFFRELKNAVTIAGRKFVAGGHVEILPESGDESDANRYRVMTSPLLSRMDCAVIESLLAADASLVKTHKAKQKAVLENLQMLAGHDPMEWINQPVDFTSQARTIQDVVRRVLGIEEDLSEELATACEKLYDRILSAFGKIFITHYFLRTVVPMLGLTHPQAWAIILLRDRCWYDHETHTQKDFAIVRGGMNTLACWLGVTRKSLESWMRQTEFAAFVRAADMSRLGIPEDWQASSTQIFLVSQLEPVVDGKKRDSGLEKARLTPGKSETQDRKKCDSVLEKMRLALRKSETLLKPQLTPINRNKPHEPQPTTPTRTAAAESLPSVWELEYFFKNNGTNTKTKKQLRESGANGSTLISWLLYASSSDPAAKKIQSPYAFALSQLLNDPDGSPGDDFDALAALPPRELIALLSDEDVNSPQSRLFDRLIKNRLGTSRYRNLLPILLPKSKHRERA